MHFTVKPGITSIQMPIHRLPVAKRAVEKSGLDKYEKAGIVEKVDEPTPLCSTEIIRETHTCIHIHTYFIYLNTVKSSVKQIYILKQHCFTRLPCGSPTDKCCKICQVPFKNTQENPIFLSLQVGYSIVTPCCSPRHACNSSCVAWAG